MALEFTLAQRSDCPSYRVFRALTDLDELKAWMPNLIRIDKGSSRKGEYRFHYRLEPDAGGTRVRLHALIGGMGWFGELVGKLLLGAYRRAIRKDLEALRAYLYGERRAEA